MAYFTHVYCPVDGSEPSLRALEVAAGLARSSGSELTVATVLDLGQLDFYDGIWLSTEQVEAWQEKVRAQTLSQAQERLDAHGVTATLRLLRGPVVRSLLDDAAQHSADLLVVGRTGKGALERLAQGSVSRQLSAQSPVPVMTVP
jgi:nucleotide-binding universal stress UspA family protein